MSHVAVKARYGPEYEHDLEQGFPADSSLFTKFWMIADSTKGVQETQRNSLRTSLFKNHTNETEAEARKHLINVGYIPDGPKRNTDANVEVIKGLQAEREKAEEEKERQRMQGPQQPQIQQQQDHKLHMALGKTYDLKTAEDKRR